MAISETTLKDVMLMLIDEQNKKGGVLGKKLEAVVVDPASNWPLFAEKARELISKDKVAAVFGCWTSVSRKSVLPVFKELNSILFYPVQYEGEESERNVFYTGAAPNQQAIPAVDYLMSEDGGSVKRWVLAGTDYVYPRTTNKILEAYLKPKGVAGRRHHDQLHAVRPLRLADRIVARSRSSARPARRPPWSRPSTATPTCRSTRSSATRASRRPTSRSSRSRSARKSSPASTPSRWSAISPPGTTSRSIDTPANKAFIDEWHDFTKNPKRTTNDPMEAHYIGFNMWVKAVEKAGTTDPDKVIDALIGIEVPNLTGGISTMMPNHHITKPVLIGEIQADGQFDVVWKTPGLVPGARLVGLPRRTPRTSIADWRARSSAATSTSRPASAAAARLITRDALTVNARGRGGVCRLPASVRREPRDALLPSLPRRCCYWRSAAYLALRRRMRASLDEALAAFHRRRFQRDRQPASAPLPRAAIRAPQPSSARCRTASLLFSAETRRCIIKDGAGNAARCRDRRADRRRRAGRSRNRCASTTGCAARSRRRSAG